MSGNISHIEAELKKFISSSPDFRASDCDKFFEPFRAASNVNFFLKKEVDENFYGYNESMKGMTVSEYLSASFSIARTLNEQEMRIANLTPMHQIKFQNLVRNLDAHPVVQFQSQDIFV